MRSEEPVDLFSILMRARSLWAEGKVRKQEKKKHRRKRESLAFSSWAAATSCPLGFLKVVNAKKSWTYLPVCYTSEVEGHLLLFVLLKTVSTSPLDFIGDAPPKIFGQDSIKPNYWASQMCILACHLFPHLQSSCPVSSSGSKRVRCQ